jgi:uncharacterized protein (DUF1501 family)
MWTTMTMTGGVDGASLKIGAKSFTEEALLAAITKIELGNLKYTVDFRSVYQTLIRDWFQGDAATVLGATYPELPFINKAQGRPALPPNPLGLPQGNQGPDPLGLHRNR